MNQTARERVVAGLKDGPKTGPEIEDLLRDVPVSVAMSVMERLIWDGTIERGARQFHLADKMRPEGS